ncbi:MAG: YhjD/YihY/BrkB family envelope integrity protein [Gaiellales bacterium]
MTTQTPERPPGTIARLYSRAQASREPLERSLVGRIVLRFDIIDGSDRAAVLALNALLSLVPLAVLGVAIAHVYGITSSDYADGLTDVLNLHGRTAQYVHESSASVNDSIRSATVVGLGGLIWTAFGFTSALWRVYDRAWGGHSHAGPRAWLRGFVWLVVFTLGHALVALARSKMDKNLASDLVLLGLSLAIGFLVWLVSPSLLLGRRLPLRVVAPGAALMAVGTVAFLVGSSLVMPGLVDDYAAPLGPIGVAIALGFWLWAIAYLWVASAVVTAVLAENALEREHDALTA